MADKDHAARTTLAQLEHAQINAADMAKRVAGLERELATRVAERNRELDKLQRFLNECAAERDAARAFLDQANITLRTELNAALAEWAKWQVKDAESVRLLTEARAEADRLRAALEKADPHLAWRLTQPPSPPSPVPAPKEPSCANGHYYRRITTSDGVCQRCGRVQELASPPAPPSPEPCQCRICYLLMNEQIPAAPREG